ncbi:MAG: DUF5357 family protein [Coleofasciculaceae cyanobacterium]
MKFFRDFFGFLASIPLVGWLIDTFRPKTAFSWQTLFWLSVFSYCMSLLADGVIQVLLGNFGWIFLILAVFWGTSASEQLKIGGLPLSPWLTGALASIYIFVIIGGNSVQSSEAAIVYWPLVSAIIAVIPAFVKDELNMGPPQPQQRQNIAILLLSQLLLSCWFQFYFIIQGWLAEYPSVLADHQVNRSAFVVKLEPTKRLSPRGTSILDMMASQLKEQLDARPWSEVEKSLLPEELNQLVQKIEQQAKDQISPVEEDMWWEVKHDISSRGSGYNLEMKEIWKGPRSGTQTYYVTRSCQITQVYPQSAEATKAVSRVKCEPPKGWGIDDPIVAMDQ